MANKIVLVTGGSRGIGRDMALKLAAKGLDVIITYNSKADEAQQVVAEITAAGQKAAALQLTTDKLSTFDGFVEQLKNTLSNTFGAERIDYLINNAGKGSYGAITEVTEEQFDEVMNIHFKGVYFLTQKLLPLINDGGGIVNVSTALTRITFAGSSAYAAMKSAVETFTKYLAKELGSRGIRANVIAPGPVMTDFGDGHIRNNPDLQKAISSITALGRPGVADDIGGVAVLLCSDDAHWVTGQRIEASGGTQL
jgi:NAD(P)-dependent dehydrogenase (short-subunit alcohol dehydrogenase family)